MDWIWPALLLAILLGPILWTLVSGVRREPPRSATHQDVDMYRERFTNWPKRGKP